MVLISVLKNAHMNFLTRRTGRYPNYRVIFVEGHPDLDSRSGRYDRLQRSARGDATPGRIGPQSLHVERCVVDGEVRVQVLAQIADLCATLQPAVRRERISNGLRIF